MIVHETQNVEAIDAVLKLRMGDVEKGGSTRIKAQLPIKSLALNTN